MEEQRRAPRFKASIPVEVGEDGGLTIDISSTGIAFESDRSFEIGQEIPLQLRLSDGDFPLSLQCSGRVVRVEEHDGLYMIGTTVEWLEKNHLEFAS